MMKSCLGAMLLVITASSILFAQEKIELPNKIKAKKVETDAIATELKRVQDQESPAAPAIKDPLKDLRWMIGEWHDPENKSSIAVKCSAYGKRGFIKREFKLQIDEETSMEVVQMIGFDPVLQRIQSWTFDTEGGYGTATWTQDGNQWTNRTSFQLATGETAASTNVIKKVDENTIRWKSVNRQIGDQIQPSIGETTLVRKQ